mmetsp:Transcript_8695/g.8705  ORF Transcript_8695/g.8705 Transcript_8695/m.8705 type:complete len:530 (-) Transcript_8695:31-1620(-)
MYACVYFHTPELLNENLIIKACFEACVFVIESIHKLVHLTTCLREDDYGYSGIKFQAFEVDEHDLEQHLLAAEKGIENENILGALRFFRALFYLMNNLVKPKGSGLSAAESYIPFITKQLEGIKGRNNEFFSEVFNEKYCLTKVPYFGANKIYKVENYTFQMAISRIEAFIESLSRLCSIQEATDLDHLISFLNSIPSFDIASRVLYEYHLFETMDNEIKVFHNVSLQRVLMNSMQKYGIDINLISQNGDFTTYLKRVEIVYKETILLSLKNKTRQQRILPKYFSDFNILISEANYVEQQIFGKQRQGQLIFQWIFTQVMSLMILYLRLSFELKLYAVSEIGMAMFYMDFLYGAYLNGLKASIEFFTSKQAKKKKLKCPKYYQDEYKLASGLRLMCRGMVRLHAILIKYNLIENVIPEIEIPRFNKRFKAFNALQIPQKLEYDAYETVKFLPKTVEIDRLIVDCKESFDSARSLLKELEGFQSIKELMRVCVWNTLAIGKGVKAHWECKANFEYNEDSVFSTCSIQLLT